MTAPRRVPGGCPARLALCGVPCGCNGRNPSHRPAAAVSATRTTENEESER